NAIAIIPANAAAQVQTTSWMSRIFSSCSSSASSFSRSSTLPTTPAQRFVNELMKPRGPVEEFSMEAGEVGREVRFAANRGRGLFSPAEHHAHNKSYAGRNGE